MPIMAIAPEYVGLTDPVGIHCDSIYIDHRLASTYLDSDVRRYVVSGSAEIIYNAAFGYAFSAQGATSKAVLVSGPGDYSSNSPTYGRLYVGCTECGAYLTGYGDITNNGRWLPLTGTPYSVTYTANQD